MSLSRDRHGFLLTEVMVSLTVLGVLGICIAVTASGVQRLHQALAVRQRCIAAAQAQIESIVARDTPIHDDKVQALWPGVDLHSELVPGQGQWQGLELIRVTASARSGRSVIRLTMARYRPLRRQVNEG